MDETGHSGDTGSTSGGSAESRDRTLLNGWASSGNPWSAVSGQVDEPEEDIPAWRRPAQEIRPFTRQAPPAERPSSDLRPFAPTSPAPAPAPAPVAQPDPTPQWSDGNQRYEDLLKHFNPGRGVEPIAPSRFQALSRPDSLQDDDRRPAPGQAGGRPNPLRDVSLPRIESPSPPLSTPSSAPPYPYEGDLDDDAAQYPRPQATFPAVRPMPQIRRPEPARHALDPTPLGGSPHIEPQGNDMSRTAETPRVRASYDPETFPRRLPYEPPPTPQRAAPPNENTTAYAPPAAYASAIPVAEQTVRGLPQRVPAMPDVPTVPEPPSSEPTAETPALARIATHLRRDDLLAPQDRQEGFDVQAILAAVREVEGVRDAMLRTTPQGANSLRLDLAEGADPAEVSRQVARLLQDRMGLDAAMQGEQTAAPAMPAPTMPAPTMPAPAMPAPAAPQSPLPSAPPSRVPSQPGPSEPLSGSAPVAGQDLRRMPTAPQRVETPEPEPEDPYESATPGPLDVGEEPGPRVMIDNVQVTTFGTEATVEVKLEVDGRTAKGLATGPAVDGYLLRLCATAAAEAINDLLTVTDRRPEGPARCFVEHAGAVPFGTTQVAVVVMLLSVGGAWVEQLAGSAMIGNDGRHAMVRATLAAVNRRLEALLSR